MAIGRFENGIGTGISDVGYEHCAAGPLHSAENQFTAARNDARSKSGHAHPREVQQPNRVPEILRGDDAFCAFMRATHVARKVAEEVERVSYGQIRR